MLQVTTPPPPELGVTSGVARVHVPAAVQKNKHTKIVTRVGGVNRQASSGSAAGACTAQPQPINAAEVSSRHES
jgi:hypothetical protein